MKFLTIALVCLVVGASAVEQAGFFDKVRDFGKKVMSNPIVTDKILPFVQQQGTKLVNDQLAKKNIPMQFAEEAGFFDKIKSVVNKVKDVVKPVVNSDLVKNQLLPMAQQTATSMLNQQLAKKNIPMQFAEESGFFDKIKDFGKKVISNPIVQDKILPFVQQQGTKLVNDQLAKKNIPMQFAEQSGFFDKIKDFGKKVISNPIVQDKILPFVQQQGTKLVNDQLAKKNIPVQFAEQSGFFDKIKDFGKKVISHPIVQDKVLPFVQQQGTKLVNDQLAKKNIPVQF